MDSSVAYDGYLARIQTLLSEVQVGGPAACSTLAARLGWKSGEVRGKLCSLRTQGVVTYREGKWAATTCRSCGGDVARCRPYCRTCHHCTAGRHADCSPWTGIFGPTKPCECRECGGTR